MKYSLSDATMGEDHLAGATLAQSHMRGLRIQLAAYLQDHDSADVVLDYGDIETITASYARHTMGWLLQSGGRSVGRESEGELTDVGDGTIPVPLPIYPFATGLSVHVRDELRTALTRTVDLRLCFLEAVRLSDEDVIEARLIGDLESPLLETLRLVSERGEVTATDLYQAGMIHGQSKINATAWNNRLADLHRLRVLRRRRDGRHWIYFPAVSRIHVMDAAGPGDVA